MGGFYNPCTYADAGAGVNGTDVTVELPSLKLVVTTTPVTVTPAGAVVGNACNAVTIASNAAVSCVANA